MLAFSSVRKRSNCILEGCGKDLNFNILLSFTICFLIDARVISATMSAEDFLANVERRHCVSDLS